MSSKKSTTARKAPSVPTKHTTTTSVPRKKVFVTQQDQDAFLLKRYNTLPYSTAQSGPGASLSTAHTTNSVLSRIGSYIFGKRGSNSSSHPRMYPYPVQGGQLQYFATDSGALRPYNVSHGDRLLYGIGPMEGSYCYVIGLRAGRLWVVNDNNNNNNNINGDEEANGSIGSNNNNNNPIAVPLYGSCEKDLNDEYMFTKVPISKNTPSMTIPTVTNIDVESIINNTPEPILSFLRYAPDLILQLHSDNNNNNNNNNVSSNDKDKEVCTTYMAPTYNPETKVAGWSGADLIMNFTASGVNNINGVGVAAGCCSSRKPSFSNNDDDNNGDNNNNNEDNEYDEDGDEQNNTDDRDEEEYV